MIKMSKHTDTTIYQNTQNRQQDKNWEQSTKQSENNEQNDNKSLLLDN